VPANALREDNVLHIESVKIEDVSGDISLDNFIIDNVIVFFKTRVRVPGAIGEAVAP
jgi:hypothetical protein